MRRPSAVRSVRCVAPARLAPRQAAQRTLRGADAPHPGSVQWRADTPLRAPAVDHRHQETQPRAHGVAAPCARVLNRTTTPATRTTVARNEVGNRCSPLQVVDLSVREYASALPAAYAGTCGAGPGAAAAPCGRRKTANERGQALRGENMMTAMPNRQQAAPSRSQRVGVTPSTHHSHNSALAM